MLLPRHRHRLLPSTDCVLEGQGEMLMQIRAPLRDTLRRAGTTLLEQFREQIAEGGRRGPARADRKIESLEAHRDLFRRSRRPAAGVVPPAPLRIAQRLVRFGDLPELHGGGSISGIDVRMMPPCEPLVRALDIGQRRTTLDSQKDVKIHECASRTLEQVAEQPATCT